jgi:hypothetical protein
MNTANYLNLILSGYFKNPNTLKLYLIKHQQLAKRDDFVSLVEFYDNCNKVIDEVKRDILNLYNDEKKELYMVLSYKKTNKIDASETQKEIDFLEPNDFKIHLSPITQKQFTELLSYSDIEFIEQTIKQIFVYVDKKKDYTLPCSEGDFYYSGSENKLYTGKEFFEKIYFKKGDLKFPTNCPDLIPEYYDLSLKQFIAEEKQKPEAMLNEILVTKEFITLEFNKLKKLNYGLKDFFESKIGLLKYCERYYLFLKEKLIELKGQPRQKENEDEDEKTGNNFTSTNWFKIGLLFANGEMEALLKKFNNNGTKIAEKLGNESGLRPYITESIGIKQKTSVKSIFSNKDKMDKIITYCNEKNIDVIKSFIDKIPTE